MDIKRYSLFKIFPIGLDVFAIYIEYVGCHLYVDDDLLCLDEDYDFRRYNPDGRLVRIVRGNNSMDKSLKLCQKYERKMGRYE